MPISSLERQASRYADGAFDDARAVLRGDPGTRDRANRRGGFG
jgi:hypothetical protein